MTKTLDDVANLLIGDVLASVGGTALYADALDPMGLDLGGDEFAVNPHQRRPQPSPLAADFPDADTTRWSSAPRPAVTAYAGFDGDAYWLDGETWRHCQTGEVWNA